jgi:hypothetical protein
VDDVEEDGESEREAGEEGAGSVEDDLVNVRIDVPVAMWVSQERAASGRGLT